MPIPPAVKSEQKKAEAAYLANNIAPPTQRPKKDFKGSGDEGKRTRSPSPAGDTRRPKGKGNKNKGKKNKGKNKNTMSLNQLNGGAGGAAWGN